MLHCRLAGQPLAHAGFVFDALEQALHDRRPVSGNWRASSITLAPDRLGDVGGGGGSDLPAGRSSASRWWGLLVGCPRPWSVWTFLTAAGLAMTAAAIWLDVIEVSQLEGYQRFRFTYWSYFMLGHSQGIFLLGVCVAAGLLSAAGARWAAQALPVLVLVLLGFVAFHPVGRLRRPRQAPSRRLAGAGRRRDRRDRCSCRIDSVSPGGTSSMVQLERGG